MRCRRGAGEVQARCTSEQVNKVTKKQESSRSSAKPPTLHDAAVRLGRILADEIAGRDPGSEAARDPDCCASRWAVDIDKLHRLDKRDWQEMADVLRWSQLDPFWQNNILSGKKFRDQFTQLRANMNKKPKVGKGGVSFEELVRRGMEGGE